MRVRFGECVLDTDTRELFRKDEPVHLPPKAFRLLELLVENRPRAVAKDEIHEKVWPRTFVSEATLASAISDIRAAIGDTGAKPRFLRTVHGFGYAFSGGVVEAARTSSVIGTPCRLIYDEREIPLTAGDNVLGRDAEVDIRINDPSVSRRHARITVEDATATIQDLNSKNGTYVSASRLDSLKPLVDGDEIRVGDIPMTFRLVSEGQSTRTARGGGGREGAVKGLHSRKDVATKRRRHA